MQGREPVSAGDRDYGKKFTCWVLSWTVQPALQNTISASSVKVGELRQTVNLIPQGE